MAGMVERMQGRLRPTGETHRVTTLELLFDLVFVYAITNVTTLVEHDLTRFGVLDGVVTLAVVWFGWCSYAWLGNQACADEGLTRLAVIVAMAAMFFVAISIPHTFEDGGNAATVLVVAYAVVRFTHLFTYLVAADGDAALRSVVLAMIGVAASAVGPPRRGRRGRRRRPEVVVAGGGGGRPGGRVRARAPPAGSSRARRTSPSASA